MDKEDEQDHAEELSEPLGAAPHERRVSFRNNAARPSSINRPRSPPPDEYPDMESDSSGEDDVDVDDEDDEELSLQRFESGSARQPQMIDDDGEDEDEDEEIKTPPPMPSEDELRLITGADGDEELTDAYSNVAGCPCHGRHEHAPKASKVWDIPQKPGEHGQRYAIVAVDA